MFRFAVSRLFAVLLFLAGNALAQPLTITSGSEWSTPLGSTGIALTASGGTGTYTWSTGPCTTPPGMAFRNDAPQNWAPGATASILGVATTAGDYTCEVRVTDGANTVAQPFTIHVLNFFVTAPVNLPHATVGVAYDQTIATSGGAVTMAAQDPMSVPPGLTLAADGRLSGTPTAARNYDINVLMTQNGRTIARGLSIYVSSISITTAGQLPTATVGTAYSRTIAVTGGVPPYAFWACCLPPGISLDPSTGVLSGTPNQSGAWGFPVRVSDSAGDWAGRNFILGVAGVPPTLPGFSFPFALDDLPLGLPGYQQWLHVFGGTPPYTFAVVSGSLPPGIGMADPTAHPEHPATAGVNLVGAATAVGTYTFAIRLTDSSTPPQTATRQYTLKVSPLTDFGLQNATYGQPFSWKFLVAGGQMPYTTALVEGALPTGVTYNPSTGLVSGTPIEVGWFPVVFSTTDAAGNTLRRSAGINVGTGVPNPVWINEGTPLPDAPRGQSYMTRISAGGGSGVYNWSVTAGALPPGVGIEAGPAGAVNLSGTPTVAGVYTFTVKAVDSGDAANLAARTYRLSVTPYTLVGGSGPSWTNAGSFYTSTFSLSGAVGPVTWSVTPGYALPEGLTLTSGGVLSGSPTHSGDTFFMLTATDTGSGVSSSYSFGLQVYPAGGAPPVSITTGDWSGPVGRVMVPLQASGGTGTYSWTTSACDVPGVVLRTDAPSGWPGPGLIGVAATGGAYSCTVTVTSGAQSLSKTLKFTVFPWTIASNWQLPDGSLGVPYSYTVAGAGATPTFALESGALPPGLSLAAGGTIGGTPTAAGTYDFNLQATVGSASQSWHGQIMISPLRITTAPALPNATSGVAYSQAIAVSGGSGTYTFGTINGGPPNGIDLVFNTGVLSGTPNGPGYWGFVVQVTDTVTGAWIRKHFTLGVVGTPARPLTINPSTLEDLTVGEQNAWAIGVSGGTAPYTFAVTSGALPPGMRLAGDSELPPNMNHAGALLAGTPTTAGAYTFTIRATDSTAPTPQTTSWTYTWNSSTMSYDWPVTGTYGAPYTGRIPTWGGQLPYANLEIVAGRLPNGLTLNPATGEITGTPLETNGIWVQVKATDAAGKTFTRSMNINISAPSGTSVFVDNPDPNDIHLNSGWQRDFWAYGGSNNFNWTLASGSLPPGLTLSHTVGQFATLSGTPTAAGQYTFSLRATDTANAANFGVRTLTIQVTPLSFQNMGLPCTNVSGPVNFPITTTGGTGTLTYSVVQGSVLPPGVTLNPTTGVISGSPLFPGAYSFEILVTDSGTGRSLTRRFNIDVYPAGAAPPLSIITGDWTGPVGRVMVQLQASGGTGTYSWTTSACNIPGVVLRTDTGPGLNGVATTAGTFSCTVTATSGSETANQTLTFTVLPWAVASNWQMPDGSLGVAYSFTVRAAGATPTFTLESGTLPPGLNIAEGGTISGTPTAAGTYDFNLRATVGSAIQSWHGQIVISPLRITTPAALPNATERVSYSQAIAVSGGSGTYTYGIVNGGTPGEIPLNFNTGVLSGTPNGPGYWGFVVQVTDTVTGAWIRKHFNLGVVATPARLMSINPPRLEDLTVGEQSSWMTIGVNGGTPPYTFAVTSGALPQGIRLIAASELPPNVNHAGVFLGGTPTTAGLYGFTIRATDSAVPTPQTTSWTYAWNVSPMTFDAPPNGAYGAPYSGRLFTWGGQLPYANLAIVAGRLPNGLTLNAATGEITGTPLETGGAWMLMRATDAAGKTLTRSMNIDIAGPSGTRIDIDNPNLEDLSINNGWQRDFWAWGGSNHYNWTLESGNLPPGLLLTTTLGQFARLSGSPTAAGQYTFTLRATDSANAANFGVRTITIRVTQLNLTVNTGLPWTNVNSPVNYPITTTGATGTLTYSLTPLSAFPASLTLNATTGVIGGSPAYSGTFSFQITVTDSGTGQSLTRTFSLDVYAAGAAPPLAITAGDGTWSVGRVEHALTATGGTGVYTWSVGACAIPGVVLRTDVSPSWQGVSAGLIGVATTPGNYTCAVTATSGSGNATKTLNFTIYRLQATKWELPDGSVGAAYNQWLTATGSGGAISFALSPGNSMPPGLNLSSTGEITGTPTAAGTYSFNYTAMEGAATASRGVTITISELQITSPTNLPNAINGLPYDYAITVTGGTGPYTFWGCCLGNGLSLSSTGVISGTAAGINYYDLNLIVTDSAGKTAHKRLALGVVGVPVNRPTINMSSMEDTSLGEQWAQSLYISGGTPPYTWSVVSGSLPPGMSLLPAPAIAFNRAANAGMISGVPTTVGTYPVVLQATDATGQTVSKWFAIRISPLAFDSLPDGTFGTPYNKQIRVLGGPPPYTYALVQGTLPAGLSHAAGQVSGTPTEVATRWAQYRFTGSAGELIHGMSLTIAGLTGQLVTIDDNPLLGDRSPGSAFSRTFSASGGTSPYNWSVEGGSVLPGSLALNTFGGLSGSLPASSGSYSFGVRATDTAGNWGVTVFTINVTPMNLTISTDLGFGNVGVALSRTLAVSGATGTVAWSLPTGGPLPPGLSLSAAGVLSGTPSTVGQYWFNLKAADSGTGGSRTWLCTFDVYPNGYYPPLAMATLPDLGTWSIGTVQSQLVATGGTGVYTWSLASGPLPPGLSVRADKAPFFASDASAGVIGVATAPGTYPFTLSVTSGGQTVSQSFTMKIVKLLVKDPNAPDAFLGEPYSYTFSNADPNGGPVTWSVLPNTTLPPGLSLSPDGVLSGTPAEAATYSVSVVMSDGVDSASRTVRLLVAPVHITTVLQSGTQNTPYSQTLAATGGSGSYFWSWGSSLPGGLSLSSAGVLSGTPTSAGTWNFTITAADAAARMHRKYYSLTILGTPPIQPSITNGSNFDDFSLGEPRVVNFWVSGGTAPYRWSIAGAPDGMTIRDGASPSTSTNSASGELWGTPTTLGVYPVTVSVTDSSVPPVTVSRNYTMRVVTLVHDSNDGIPGGTRGAPYSVQLRTLGGNPSYTWIVNPGFPPGTQPGVLPAGLTLNAATGVVSGTPLENGNFTTQFRIADGSGVTYIRSFNFNIGGSPIPGDGSTTISISTGTPLGTVVLNQPYSRTLAASGASSFRWSAMGTLPAWLSLNASTGVLSGTPTVAGIYTFMIRAEDANVAANFGVKLFTLNVTPLVLTSSTTLPYANQGTPYTATLTVTGATGSVTWSLPSDSLLPPGLNLVGNAITGSPTSNGAFGFTLRATDGAGNTLWSGFSLAVYPAGMAPPLYLPIGANQGPMVAAPFGIQLAATGGFPPYAYSWAPTAQQLPGARFQHGPPLPTNFSSATTAGLLGLVTTPGVYVSPIRVTDSHGQTYDAPVTFTFSPIFHTTQTNLPRALLQAGYSFQFTAIGGAPPYTWTATNPSNLPPGVSVTSSGQLAGTPTTAGTYTFSVMATDTASSSITNSYTLQVTPFSITTFGVLPQATTGSLYSTTLNTSLGAATWSMVNNLPGGLSLNPSTGVISGTPTGAGQSQFTVQAAIGGNTVRKVFSIYLVNGAPLAIGTGATLTATPQGNLYTTNLAASGGAPPYTWSLVSGELPPGLTLSNACDSVWQDGPPAYGCLVGRPATAGPYTFTLQVRDGVGASVTRTFTLNVASIAIQYTSLPISGTTLTWNTPYSQSILAVGGTGTYSWSAQGTMPAGLTLSPAGTVSGTPASTGSFTVPILASDGAGASILRNVTFNVVSGTPASLTIGNGPDLGIYGQGSPYSVTLNPSGSPSPTPNYTFSVMAGYQLPPGCALLSGSALLSGQGTTSTVLSCVPAAAGNFSFGLQVQDSLGNRGMRVFAVHVAANTIFTGTTLPDGAVGVGYSQTLLAWGAPQTWALAAGSTLPPGLALSPAGVLSGTPTTAGNYSFNVTVTDGSGIPLPATYSVLVSSIGITDSGMLPAATVLVPYTYTFADAAGKTWSIVSGSLPNGLTLSPAGTIAGTTTRYGNFNFKVRATSGGSSVTKLFTLPTRDPNPWVLSYPLSSTVLGDVPVGQSLSYALNATDGVSPYTWTVAAGSSLPPGLGLYTGTALPGSIYPVTTLLAGAPTVPGAYSFTLQVTDAAGGTIQRTLSLNVTTLAIASGSLRSPTYQIAYSQALTAIGGTGVYTWTLAGGALPAGLSLSSAGVISGTPSETGSFSFQARVADNAGASLTRASTLFVNSTTPATLDITTTAQPEFAAGGYQYGALAVSGGAGPYTWSVTSGALPPGLNIAPGSAISPVLTPANTYYYGWPTTPGSYTFTLRVNDSIGNVGHRTFNARVAAIRTYNPPWSPATTGVAFSYPISAVGGTPPHTFALAPGNYLPTGVTLSPGGVVSGTTTLSGAFTFALTITDSLGYIRSTSRTLAVLPAGKTPPLNLVCCNYTTTDASVGVGYAFRLNPWIGSGTPPYRWSVAAGSTLPPGLILIPGDATIGGHVTGVPNSTGVYNYQLTVSDGAGQSVTIPLTTTVSQVGVAPAELALATAGAAYNTTLTPSGGTPPYAIQSSFPPGLLLGVTLSGAVLSGTPAVPGLFTQATTVSDATAATLNRPLRLVVDSAATPMKWLTANPAAVQFTLIQGSPAVPIGISSGSASINFTAVLNGIPGAALSVVSGATPATTNLSFAGTPPGTYLGVIEVASPQAFNGAVAVPVAVTIVAPPPCSYAATPTATTIDTVGGSGTVSVTAGAGCSWTVSANPWITLNSPASGSGNGSVNFTVATNPAGNPARTGAVTITGINQTVQQTVTQFGSTCSFTLSPSSLAASAGAGAGPISVTASQSGCAWTASSGLGWVHITSGASGTGSGTVMLGIDANAGAVRSGAIAIAGLALSVTQGAAACSVSLNSSSADMTSSGGVGAVTASLRSDCSYTATAGPNWITINSGAAGTGPTANVLYTVAANSSTQARSGSIAVGDQLFQVNQAGVSCAFTVTGNNPVYGYTGGNGSVSVAANGQGCNWTSSSNAAWLHVLSGGTGLGAGSVTFSVDTNATPSARSGTITVAGQTVTVNQSAAVCSYNLRSPNGTVPASGGNGTVGVVSASVCTWTASSNAPWLSVVSSAGSGTGDVTFAAEPNAGAAPRSGSLTVAGQTYSVTQAGAPCSYTLASASASVAATGGSGSVAFTTTQTGCTPAPVSYSNWIVPSVTFAGTAGTLSFTAAPNPVAAARSGTIQLGDRTFTVNQIAGACSFALSSYGAAFGAAGGTGDVFASASSLGCQPVIGKSPEITIGPLSLLPTNIYDQPYTVPVYGSFIVWVRMLEINVSGQAFIIKQTSW
jgi:hypothetical protein